MRISRKATALLLLTSGALFVAVAFFTVYKPVGKWREQRLIRHAQTALKAQRKADAALYARRALDRNPRCAAACEIFAELAEAEKSSMTLLWRQKLVELEPDNVARLLSLASAAVRFGEFEAATQALNAVPETRRRTVAFRQTAAALAIGARDYAAAAAQFQEAIAIEPTNEALQVSLATVQIAAGDPATAETGRKSLERLRASPACRLPALRALLADAQRRQDTPAARKLAALLPQDPAATLEDKLLYLEELQRGRQPQFSDALSDLQTAVAGNADAVAAVMHWLNTHGGAKRTVEWSRTLPPALNARPPVPLSVAEAFAELGDWNSLRELAADANWHSLNFLRVAIHMRALDESSKRERAEYFHQKWRETLQATDNNPAALTLVARLVEGWGWPDQAAEAWWLVANRSASPRPALLQLFRLYSKTRNAEELYRVSQRIYRLDRNDPIAQNNVASLGLLLDRDTAEAHRLAERVYRAAPGEPTVAATYAHSLHLQGRTREAVEVLRSLPETALRADPSVAACFGVVLAATGERGVAQPYLEYAAENRAQLLAPEIALVNAAQQLAASN